MDSVIIKLFAGLYSGLLNVIYDSRSYKIFSAFSAYIKNAAKKSLLVGFILNPVKEKSQENSWIQGIFNNVTLKINDFIKPVQSLTARVIRGSRLINVLFDFYSNMLFLPLRTYGLISVTAGIAYISLTGIVNRIGLMHIFVSVALVVVGGVMTLFNVGLYEIFNDSKVIHFILGKSGSLEILNLSDARKNKTHYLTAIILGLLTACLPVFLPPMFAAAGIVALFAVPAIMVWPVIGIAALCISIAFIPTLAAAGLILLTWMSVIINCSLGRMTMKDVLRRGRPVLLFIIITLSGGIFSFAIADSINIALIYTVFISSVYIFLALVKDRFTLKAVLLLSGLAAFLTALFGLYQYLTGNIEVGWVDSEMFEGIVRIYSTFENPNVYGEYLLFMIPISLVFFFSSKRFIYKLFWMGAGLMMVVAMLLTMSRGCWIGLIAGVFIYFLVADRRFLWLFFAGVVILPFVLPESIMLRLLSIGNLEDSSSLYRLFIWLGTFKMLGDYWLTGVGLGTKAFSGIYSAYAYNGIIAPHPHNLYLNVLSERGITGFICLAIISLKSLRYSISSVLSGKSEEKNIGAAIAAAFTGIFVQGIFDNVFYNYRIVLIFWMFVAMSFAFYNINKKSLGGSNG
ncbi:MAG: O-antigen ligase family protein [Clostridia bacterium]|nr:O-antigen ligase family protein [Clostridia bacterium]